VWIQPKTNWSEKDYFNIEDYNRIKNNINEIRSQAILLWADFSIEDMGADKTYHDYGFYADEINKFENNIEHLKNGIYSFQTGEKQTFYDNQLFINYQELNRIEKACLIMYQNVQSRIHGRHTLAFILNGGFI